MANWLRSGQNQDGGPGGIRFTPWLTPPQFLPDDSDPGRSENRFYRRASRGHVSRADAKGVVESHDEPGSAVMAGGNRQRWCRNRCGKNCGPNRLHVPSSVPHGMAR